MALSTLAHQNEEVKKSMAPHREDNCRILVYKDKVYGGLYLDYSGCRLKSFQLPQGVSPKDVTSLNLEKTSLKAFPSIIFEMSNLSVLDLRHNRLTYVPPQISKLSKLRVLKLAVNSLTELPEAICEMESLEVLHLGENELTRLPRKFGNLRRLKMLWINGNCFAHFPPQITNIITLEELYAQGNEIRNVPEEIIKLANMTYFYIQKNKLTSLPTAIETLMKSKLTDFDYDSKKVKEFPHGHDQDISKINGTFHQNTKRKSLGAEQKQTRVKRNKPASTTKAANVKNDSVADAKRTEASDSVPESSQLRVAHQTPENEQPTVAMCGEQLHSPAVAQNNGEKPIINIIFNAPVTMHTSNYYQSVNNCDTDYPDKSTMDTKDPLNDLIHFTADRASAGFKDIARKLDLSENDIERIEQENRKIKECCIRALNMWRERGGKDATVEVLKKALIDSGHKDIADAFEDANPGFQVETPCDSGQVEEETCTMEAVTSNNCNVESDRRRHKQRQDTTNQIQHPQCQATIQPKSTLPKEPIEEGSTKRFVTSNSHASHREFATRAPNDNSRSLSSTCAQPTYIESQTRRTRQGNSTGSFNTWANKRRAEQNQDQTERQHQSRPSSDLTFFRMSIFQCDFEMAI